MQRKNMNKKNPPRYFSADFETTVYEGQTYTEVWASAMVEFNTEEVSIKHSIDEWFKEVYDLSRKDHLIIYFHNLKFDGSFILPYLLTKTKLEPAYNKHRDSEFDGEWMKDNQMPNNSYKYSISDRGQWYTITIKLNKHIVEIRDSLKLLPFSVEEIGESFKTKHRKLTMKYEGFRYAGCPITEEEKTYIANDVLVVKEALEFMFSQGHNKLTIGSCCLSEFKATMDKEDYKNFFPDLSTIYVNTKKNEMYESEFSKSVLEGHYNVDTYLRSSYKGGWCYVRPEFANRIIHKGLTLDVNSLYPSVMSGQHDKPYPIGLPTYWKGNYIPAEALAESKYFFVKIRTRFKLKPNYLPFIQIKGSWFYKGNECLTTSDIYNPKDGKYYDCYIDIDGNKQPAIVELTLTQTDYDLFLEHYDVSDFEIIDGMYFQTIKGIFDMYIDKYRKIKMTSKGAMRQLAKLFLNNLYGKMATNKNSSFKYCYMNQEENTLGFIDIIAYEKRAGYIPIGSAITSYAREFTIRTAQKNYKYFIYADTDSLHLCTDDLTKVKGVKLHESEFCCWKCETFWDEAIFVRQKTYIEHVTHEDLEELEKPYYNIKCAGLPKKANKLLNLSMTQDFENNEEFIADLKPNQLEWAKTKRTITDFKVGLTVPASLKAKRIEGGTVLIDGDYIMR